MCCNSSNNRQQDTSIPWTLPDPSNTLFDIPSLGPIILKGIRLRRSLSLMTDERSFSLITSGKTQLSSVSSSQLFLPVLVMYDVLKSALRL